MTTTNVCLRMRALVSDKSSGKRLRRAYQHDFGRQFVVLAAGEDSLSVSLALTSNDHLDHRFANDLCFVVFHFRVAPTAFYG